MSEVIYYIIMGVVISVIVFILWNIGVSPAFHIVTINIAQALVLGVTITLIKVLAKL